jgi:eukaryotic-like serine/threonine-protein kinase
MASSDATTSGLPSIPDYQLLKKIGQGAYGEVWLSRSLTGAFRAIKIVRREKFEHEEAFEREFHGIRNYEKVSRSHPALLDVLHVGRLRAPEIYYYVMELGDPVGTLPQHDGAWCEYTPRTLATFLKSRKPMPPREAAKIGARLAEALDALHRSGLIHRDVKPSNIVFVGGRPKLADLGLVAADGQQTYVGTVGYLAPEGPGSPLADIYSLGKVLYEINTGRDRIDFPRMPEDFESIPDKDVWRRMNTIVCKACSTMPRQRQPSAEALGAELTALDEGRVPTKGRRPFTLFVSAVGLAAMAVGLFLFAKPAKQITEAPARPTPTPAVVEPTTGHVKVVSDPPGAQVVQGDKLLGTTPLVLPDIPAGPVELKLVKAGFRTVTLKDLVKAGGQILLGGEMSVWRPPVTGELWKNGLGIRFVPAGAAHLSSDPVQAATWEKILEKKLKDDDMQATLDEARSFCAALTERDRKSGYLGGIQRYRPAAAADFSAARISLPAGPMAQENQTGIFHIVAETLPHGTVNIDSEPDGARVTLNGDYIGEAGITIDEIPAGPVEVRVEKDGYEPVILKGTLVADGMLDLKATLPRSRMLVFGTPWANSLGMRFVPLGGDLMVALWETRLRDYAACVAANSSTSATLTDFPQTPDDPVVLVSRDDAAAFCQWLTERDRKNGFLPGNAVYRLPTDGEWSRLAGQANEQGHSPAARDGQLKGEFPWGALWPPPTGAGNFADTTLTAGKRGVRGISRYTDGFPQTAPVGSFSPNALGIFDVAGNVWEWVADDYGGTGPFAAWAVVRGGSWANEQRELLWTSYRNLVKPTMRDPIFGFRVVIAKSAQPTAAPQGGD